MVLIKNTFIIVCEERWRCYLKEQVIHKTMPT